MIMSKTTRELKKLVERRHPMYDRMLSHWRFLEETYYGGREWFKSHIFMYHKEGEDEFNMRVKRAYRFNHTREVVDLVNKYLFRAKPDRVEDASDAVKRFWSKATSAGLSIDELMRSASIKSSIFGRPWMIVDSSVRADEGATRSLKDDENDGGRIYAYIVKPENVLDMSYDERGELNWIMIREEFRDDEDPFNDEGEVGERFRLWTRNDWYLIKKVGRKYELIDEKSGPHGLGVVPAIQIDNQICDDSYDSPALIADIAYLDRAVANYLSNMDAIIQDQTFSQLTMPAQNLLPGDSDHNKLLEAGTKRIFTYDGEAGGKPEFISPDPSQAEMIISAIQQIINEIYHSVGLAGERTKSDNAKGIDNSSGIAKSKDFERVNALLVSKADSLELVENKMVRLVSLWAGEKPPEKDLVSYSDNFDVRELYDEFYIAMQLSLIDSPDSLRREQLKAIVGKLFPMMPAKKRSVLLDDIDNWEFAKESISPDKSKINEEAKRDREQSGKKQSTTKKTVSESQTNAVTE